MGGYNMRISHLNVSSSNSRYLFFAHKNTAPNQDAA